jgi:hypothetical protein
MPVDEMLDRMSSRELTEWMVYEEENGPLGPGRSDQLAALVAAVIANANRSKRGRTFKPADFMPRWGHRRRRQSPEEQTAVMQAFVEAGGGAKR